MAVAPTPTNGSRTSSPGCVYSSTKVPHEKHGFLRGVWFPVGQRAQAEDGDGPDPLRYLRSLLQTTMASYFVRAAASGLCQIWRATSYQPVGGLGTSLAFQKKTT